MTKDDLYCALMMKEIVPYYQPIIDTRNHSLFGVEVLMRWHHAGDESAPEQLLNAFEEHGLMAELTQHLLTRVATEFSVLDRHLPQGMHLSFNVNPSQVAMPGFVFDTLSFVSSLPLEKYRVVVEVNESQPLAQTREVFCHIRTLQLAGVAVYLDDFGTGWANLSCLEHFNIDGLKIDKLFVDTLPQNPQDASVASVIAQLAQRKGLTLIAEGIESPEQSHQLDAIGITLQQGYLFSRALSQEQFKKYLTQVR